jgi:hypothetical protein
MALYDRMLGMVAAFNANLGAIRLLHHIPLSGLVLVLLVVVFVDGIERIGGPKPGGPSALVVAIPILEVVLPPSALGLSLICLMRRNLIFRPTDRHITHGAIGSEGDRRQVDLRASGRFRRAVGQTLWLRDSPAAWDISEDGTISLVASVRGGGYFHGFSSSWEDPSGMWSLALPRELLKQGLEDGVLYFGFSARPALRLRSRDMPEAIVLSVRDRPELMELHRTFDEVLAESARNEAAFARRLEEIAAQAPAEKNTDQAIAEKKTDGGIEWEKFIDLSK